MKIINTNITPKHGLKTKKSRLGKLVGSNTMTFTPDDDVSDLPYENAQALIDHHGDNVIKVDVYTKGLMKLLATDPQTKAHLSTLKHTAEDYDSLTEAADVGVTHVILFKDTFYAVDTDDLTVEEDNFSKFEIRGKYYFNLHTQEVTLLTRVPAKYSIHDDKHEGLDIIYDPDNTQECPICGSLCHSGATCSCQKTAADLWDSSGKGLESYSHVPDYKTRRVDDDDTSNTFGVELEMVGHEKGHPNMTGKFKDNDFLYLMSDGSLPGQYGVEMASHPFSANYLLNTPDIFEIEYLTKIGMESKEYSECGTHVHISKSNFENDEHYDRFFRLLTGNVRYVESIAGRSCMDYCKAMAYPNYEEKKLSSGDGKPYYIANRSDTIEFRLFKGDLHTLDFNVMFLDAIIEYTRKLTTGFVAWTSFKAYLKKSLKSSDKYEVLREKFVTKKVPKGVFPCLNKEEY